MHKMRKLLLLLLFPLVMFSCGINKYYGYYMFQLGPDKGDHFGFYIDLTKNEYVDPKGEIEGKKEFKFGMRASGSFIPKEPQEEDYPDDPMGYAEAMFMYVLISLLNTEPSPGVEPGPGVDGYYSIGDKDIGDYGRKLDLNIVLELEPKYEEYEEFLKKLIIAYVDGKTVSAILPVSLEDFRYQLCWYGIYIGLEWGPGEIIPTPSIELLDEYPLPGPSDPEERLGSHPSEADIIKMNNMFGPNEGQPDHEKTLWAKNWFRDFHTLTVTLLKK